MALFKRDKGKDDTQETPRDMTPGAVEGSGTSTSVPNVTEAPYWRCPGCGELLEKKSLGVLAFPGEPANRMIGTSSCGACGAGFPHQEVYGGAYDFVGEAPAGAPAGAAPSAVSIVLFREGSDAPGGPEGYCQRVLMDHYGGLGPSVRGWRMVGRLDRPTAAAVGALYAQLRDTGQLPDYGTPTEQFETDGPDGNHVAVLVFWQESHKT